MSTDIFHYTFYLHIYLFSINLLVCLGLKICYLINISPFLPEPLHLSIVLCYSPSFIPSLTHPLSLYFERAPKIQSSGRSNEDKDVKLRILKLCTVIGCEKSVYIMLAPVWTLSFNFSMPVIVSSSQCLLRLWETCPLSRTH